MPSIYATSISKFIELTNEIDVKSNVGIDPSFSTTNVTNRTTPYYSTTTPTSGGLGTTSTILIITGISIFLIALCFVICCFYRRYKRHKSPLAVTPPTLANPVIKPSVAKAKSGHTPVITPPPHPSPVVPSFHCLKPFCLEYIKTLHLNKTYFNSDYDRCFCKKCHDLSDPSLNCNNNCRQWHGWVRFGLHVHQAHRRVWSIFKEWKTSYYGTSPHLLAPILSDRFLPFEDDKLANGRPFKSGHPNPKYCTTSPSLIHASQPMFTARSSFRASNGTNYTVQLVLQCKQKPNSYTIQAKTKNFHDTEWASQTRSSIIPYGLFVRLEKK